MYHSHVKRYSFEIFSNYLKILSKKKKMSVVCTLVWNQSKGSEFDDPSPSSSLDLVALM